MLNIDWTHILFTVINLLIFYFIIKKFLFGPVNKIIKEREEEIAEINSEAELKRKEAEILKTSMDSEMERIEDLKKETLAESNAKATEEYNNIISEAKKKAQSIIDEAAAEAESQQKRILKENQNELSETILNAAAAMMAEGKASDEDRKLLDLFLAKAGEEN